MSNRETFLGDGLYVSFDGFQLKLRAPCEHGDDVVYLEPGVYSALVEYVKKVHIAPGMGDYTIVESGDE